METITEQPATEQASNKVIGLIYPEGRRRYIEFESLEDLFIYLTGGEDPDALCEPFPYYLILEDGVIIPYIPYFFHMAFAKGRLTEQELREMSIHSGI